jgi:toxin CptA
MSITWVACVLCVTLMGFAIQRGGTCTVAAVEEVLTSHRTDRLVALLETSLWVGGGLALARLMGLMGWADHLPAAAPVNGWTMLGGALLGLGALINGACAFGTVARLGSGEWVYAATPLGYFIGCWSATRIAAQPVLPTLTINSAPLDAAAWLAPAFVLYASWRILSAWRDRRKRTPARSLVHRVWSPHAATVIIGICFVVTLLLAGRWTYTDVLAELARDMVVAARLPILLLAALFGGALFGGWTAGSWQTRPVHLWHLLRCLVGGAMLGWGCLLTPGSNDSLLLVGLPLLRPYAWLAFLVMTLSICGAILTGQAWARRRSGTTCRGEA